MQAPVRALRLVRFCLFLFSGHPGVTPRPLLLLFLGEGGG